MEKRLKIYEESNSCLIDVKEFKVFKTSKGIIQEKVFMEKNLEIDSVVKKKFFCMKKKFRVFGKIGVSLDKNFLSNFDECLNLVVRFDKKILSLYKNLDILIKARLQKVVNFDILMQTEKRRKKQFLKKIKFPHLRVNKIY